ncbi:ATP-binding response regulator [Rubripirellula reticaptiva]|uniref:ATP-binding response regulator n=1 Tax=Rubripirellula reticaptiva TaxID=2528013 RepID=UPI0011B744D3|nr:ATP-binding protein [Rubripirellula reticaptiva]
MNDEVLQRGIRNWTFNIGRYSIAIFSTAIVIWFRSLLQPWLNEECPFSLFYLSVLLTAWVSGSGPAVLAIVLGTLSAAQFFIPPASSLLIEGVPELVQLTIYVIVNCVAVLLFDRAERQRRLAENRATENVRLGTDLQLADKRKDEFLALLAHELRNPLAPILSSMALLERSEGSTETVRRVREVVSRQTEHLIRITDDLLEVSRFCRGHIELLVEQLDLRDSIRDAVEMIEGAFAEKSQRFQSVIPDSPVWVDGDRVRLAQLTANLLGNASKYTPASGHVCLFVDQCNGFAHVTIKDSGIGLAAEYAERIFEPFVQVDTSRTREYGGLGVGLTIAKRLIELHHGNLSVESRGPGLGSTFTVQLPLHPNPLVETNLDTSDINRLGTLDLNTGCSGIVSIDQPNKLLLVDDNQDAAKMLRDLFESSGYQVELAADGVEAINQALRFRPSVIVMDIGLPGMDGYEAARQLRRSQHFTHVKLIALTGWGSKQDRELASQAGFDLHLVKPVAFDELLNFVRDLEMGRRQVSQAVN